MFSILDFVLVLFVIATVDASVPAGGGFDENYVVTWGNVLKLNQGEVQLSMDKSAGLLNDFFSFFNSAVVKGCGCICIDFGRYSIYGTMSSISIQT